jgi:nuclease S1
MRSLAPVLLAATLALPTSADAWSGAGHRIVAAIAESRLSPAARRMVTQVLGHASLADVAQWADALDDRDLRRLHYVNVPLAAAGYDGRRDCAAGTCAVAAIERFAADLERGRSDASRADALRWLVHLVGDVHQPLHAGDVRDRGGNGLVVRYASRRAPTTFHAVWDGEVVAAVLRSRAPGETARRVAERISPADAAAWATDATPSSWVDGSHALATTLYAELGLEPRDGAEVTLPRDYARRQRVRTERALAAAGVRLAALLDRIAAAREAQRGRFP